MPNRPKEASALKNDNPASVKISKPSAGIEVVPAARFTYAQLTDAYNQTRVDYLVPMPMNERKLIDYVHNYDLDMQLSAVALAGSEILGLAMLGVRGDEAWVTRLGVVPSGRQRGIGRTLMARLIENSRRANINRMALDVIKNNTPAETLFLRCGFRRIREFQVMRRPPKPVNVVRLGIHVEAVSPPDVPALLARRTDTPSWLTDTPSMLNAGTLLGLYAELPNGGRGWLAYQNTVFRLGRLVFEIEAGDPTEVATALLEHLHWRHPIQDTVVENVPLDAPCRPAMQAMGYIVSFNRFEMEFPL